MCVGSSLAEPMRLIIDQRFIMVDLYIEFQPATTYTSLVL